MARSLRSGQARYGAHSATVAAPQLGVDLTLRHLKPFLPLAHIPSATTRGAPVAVQTWIRVSHE